MCEASQTTAVIDFEKVPTLEKSILDFYLDQKSVPGGTLRNWESYGHKIGGTNERQRHILADPQTSGGLLVAVEPAQLADFERVVREEGLSLQPFGEMVARREMVVEVSQSVQ